MDGGDNDDIWADGEIESEPEEGGWNPNDPFFEESSSSVWIDSQDNYHDLLYGDPEATDAEFRQSFDSFEEASDYINTILTTADQFFDIYYDANSDQYEVYYMGGSE